MPARLLRISGTGQSSFPADMRLDVLATGTEAVTLYRTVGCSEGKPFRRYSFPMLFFEQDLWISPLTRAAQSDT